MTGAKMADVKDCAGDLQNSTAGVVPVDSGAPQPPARQHQPQGSPPPTVPLKSPSAQNPPGGRPASHKGGNQTLHWFACIGGNQDVGNPEGSSHNWPADSGNGLEDSGGDEPNSDPFDGNTLADSGKENAGGLPGGLSQKDRDERLRILRDKQNEERQRKLEELKQQALAAQKFREQKEEERRRRIEQLRERDEGRRQQVEERKRQIWEAERERREAILRKNQEREARIEAKRKNERSSIVFAFGSSTPRMLEPADTGGTFWGSRRATSTTNVMFSSMVGSTGGSSGGGDKTTSSSGLGASQSGVPSTSSSLSRRSSERELIGGVMAANGVPTGSKKRAVSAHALDRKPGDELRSSTSMYEVFCWSDLESGDADGTPIKGAASKKSSEPKLALSSPSIDPQDTFINPSDSTLGYGIPESSITHPFKDGIPDRNAKLVPFEPIEKVSSSRCTSRSLGTDLWVGQEALSAGGMIFRGEEGDGPSQTSPFASYGPSPRARKKTDLMPTIPSPRGTGPESIHHKGRHKSPGVARSGDATPSSPSRPLSALSVHSAAGSGVSLRHRPHLPLSPASHVTPLASPTSAPHTRKPRPVSIAITGVSSDSAVSPVGIRDIRSSRLSSDNKTRAQSATEREGGAKPPKVPSAKKSTPKPADTPSKKTAPSATEKLQATKTATKTSPKVSPVHSPGEPAQLEQITDSSEEKKDEGKEISDKSDMQKSVDGLEKQDEMKPVEGETVESKEYEKKEEKAETEMKEEQVKKEESKIDKIDVSEGKERIENSTEGKEPDKGESSQDVDMTASMIARGRITTEEEAKAALAERRRLAREQAEREAELERQRLEEERRREEERLRLEEEEQRRAEAEQLRLLEEASRLEKERLQQAIEEAQRKEKEEQQRREEEAKARAEKEEQEKKAREEAEKLRQEMEERLKKEEEERQMRRKRVEAIMLRTRAKAATPTSTPTKGGEEKEDSPSEERKEVQGQQQTTQASVEDQSGQMVLQGARERQEMTGGSSSSSEPTTTEGSPCNQGTSPGHQVSSRNDTENTMVNSGANLIMGVNNIDPLQQAVLNNNGGEITRPVEQTNGHRNGMDFGPTSAFTNVDDVRLNNTANNLLDLSDYNSLGGVNLQQTQQLQLSGGGNNAFPYSKQLSHEDTMNSNAHTAMGTPLQPSIPSAPLQSVTGELDTIIPTGSPFQVEDGLSSTKRQDKNATVGDLLS